MKKAFSLIEILVVILFIGIGAIPIYRYFITSTSALDEVMIHQLANTIASSHMEVYRNQPYRQVRQITGDLELAVPADFRKRISARLRVQEILPGKLLKIIITTSWTTPRKGEIILATLIANQNSSSGY
ncbi:MAG: hypothetical protein WA705_30390 [Candidatus Ozemobacteraceae bacterium]